MRTKTKLAIIAGYAMAAIAVVLFICAFFSPDPAWPTAQGAFLLALSIWFNVCS